MAFRSGSLRGGVVGEGVCAFGLKEKAVGVGLALGFKLAVGASPKAGEAGQGLGEGGEAIEDRGALPGVGVSRKRKKHAMLDLHGSLFGQADTQPTVSDEGQLAASKNGAFCRLI